MVLLHAPAAGSCARSAARAESWGYLCQSVRAGLPRGRAYAPESRSRRRKRSPEMSLGQRCESGRAGAGSARREDLRVGTDVEGGGAAGSAAGLEWGEPESLLRCVAHVTHRPCESSVPPPPSEAELCAAARALSEPRASEQCGHGGSAGRILAHVVNARELPPTFPATVPWRPAAARSSRGGVRRMEGRSAQQDGRGQKAYHARTGVLRARRMSALRATATSGRTSG